MLKWYRLFPVFCLTVFLLACNNENKSPSNSTKGEENATVQVSNATAQASNATVASAVDNSSASIATNSTNATRVETNSTAQSNSTAAEISFLGVGFIYSSPLESAGWIFDQDKARKTLDSAGGVATYTVEGANSPEEMEKAIRSLAENKYRLIITTTNEYNAALFRMAGEYKDKDIKFLYPGTGNTSPAISSYFGRMYEAKYLAGMLAGALTKTNRIGYVAGPRNSATISSLNAFTLGVQEVNPKAIVNVAWAKSWNNPSAEEKLANQLTTTKNIDILTHHTEGTTIAKYANDHKILVIPCYSDMGEIAISTQITATVWNLAPFYKEIVEKVKKGEWEAGHKYSLGLKENIIALAPCGNMVDSELQNKVNAKEQEIIAGTFEIFKGPLEDNKNQEIVPTGTTLDSEKITEMDWLVKGIVEMEPAENTFTQPGDDSAGNDSGSPDNRSSSSDSKKY